MKAFFAKLRARLAALSGMRNARVRAILYWISILLFILTLCWLAIVLWGGISRGNRQLLVLAAVALALLLWYYHGLPWWDTRAMRARSSVDRAPGESPEAQRAALALRHALEEAIDVMRRSPEVRRSSDSLYSIPWYLVLGEEDTTLQGVLAAASRTNTVFAPTVRKPDSAWHWWFFSRMIAIECDVSWVRGLSGAVARGQWFQALELLRTNPGRGRMPLNGIVLVLSFEMLRSDPEKARRTLIEFRRLISECTDHLQITLPVYLLVAATDETPGYDRFLELLPPETLNQALGHRFSHDPNTASLSAQSLAPALAQMRDRILQIRLAGIHDETDRLKRKAIWDFGHCFEQVSATLESVVTTLLEPNTLQSAPALRGVYFIGAGGKGAFLPELFSRLLPMDQPLAARTRKPKLRRWLGSFVGLGLATLLTILATRQISVAVNENKRLVMHARTTCPEGIPGDDNALYGMAKCSLDLIHMEDLERDAGLLWGLNQYRPLLEKKKSRLILDFENILSDFDARLDAHIVRKTVSLGHFLSVVQRLSFIERCQQGLPACRVIPDQAVLMFDPGSELFDAVTGPTNLVENRQDQDSQNLTRLYLAYLRWKPEISGDRDFLDREHARARGWLKKMLAIHSPSPKDVEEWSSQHEAQRPPITLTSFWGDMASAKNGKISSAFTLATWQDIVEPLLRHSVLAGLPLTQAQRFSKEYFNGYFNAWREFLAGFDEAAPHGVTRDSVDTLAQRFRTHGTPYRRLWQSITRNLFALPLRVGPGARYAMWWDGLADDWTALFSLSARQLRAAWAGVSGAALHPAPNWLMALMHTHEAGWYQVEARLRPYQDLVEMDVAGDESLKRMGELHAGTGGVSTAFKRLNSILDRVDTRFPLDTRSASRASRVGLGELRLLLRMLGQRAARRVDTLWQGETYPQLRKLLSASPDTQIIGPIRTFCETHTNPLIDCGNGALREILNTRAPLSKWFSSQLGQPSTVPPHRSSQSLITASIALTNRSTFGVIREGKRGTQVELSCGDARLRIDSRQETKDERQVDVRAPQSTCTELRIKVALPEVDASGELLDRDNDIAAPASLVKTYRGSGSLAQVAADFKTGAKTFDVIDLKSSYNEEEWELLSRRLHRQAINQVRVFLSVTFPSVDQDDHGSLTGEGDVPSSITE